MYKINNLDAVMCEGIVGVEVDICGDVVDFFLNNGTMSMCLETTARIQQTNTQESIGLNNKQ